jgi:DNA-directed RNA polymerase specialized sigma24 family protein
MEIFSSRQYVYEYSAPLAELPEDDFITKETWAIFCRASQVLTSRQRAVFTLMELEGLSFEDTAAATGLKPNQIKNNLQIARKTIRKELERYGKVR